MEELTMTEGSTPPEPQANPAQGSDAAPQAGATAPSAAYRKAELKEAGKSLVKIIKDPVVDAYEAGRHFVHAVNPPPSFWQNAWAATKTAAKYVIPGGALVGMLFASHYGSYHYGTQNGSRREVKSVHSIAAGHLDDDAHADLVVSYVDGRIEPRYGDGTGKFNALPPSGSEPLDLEVRLNRIRDQVVYKQ